MSDLPEPTTPDLLVQVLDKLTELVEATNTGTEATRDASSEVAAERLARQSEIAAVRAERRKGNRKLACLALVLVLLFGYLALDNRADNAKDKRGRQIDRQRSAQIDWDNATSRHAECLGRADSRAASRTAWDGVLDLLAVPDPTDTEAQRVQTAAALEAIGAILDDALSPLDCDEVAPAPKGERPTVDV